jgi:microcin C transport system permease protein
MMKLRLSPLTKRRLKRFVRIKRAFVSLLILGGLFVISLGSELIANDKPLLISYDGKLYFFAAYNFYADREFGGRYDTEALYRELAETPRFKDNPNNFMLFPLIPYSPYTSTLAELKGTPPTAPDALHLLGTDDRGRDVFARLLYGFRISLSFALVLLLLEIVIGCVIGALQGRYRPGDAALYRGAFGPTLFICNYPDRKRAGAELYHPDYHHGRVQLDRALVLHQGRVSAHKKISVR